MAIGDEVAWNTLVGDDVTSMCSGEAQSFCNFGFLYFKIVSGFGRTDSKLMSGGAEEGGDISAPFPYDFVGLKLSSMRVKLYDRLLDSIGFGNGGSDGGNRAGDQIGCWTTGCG